MDGKAICSPGKFPADPRSRRYRPGMHNSMRRDVLDLGAGLARESKGCGDALRRDKTDQQA